MNYEWLKRLEFEQALERFNAAFSEYADASLRANMRVLRRWLKRKAPPKLKEGEVPAW